MSCHIVHLFLFIVKAINYVSSRGLICNNNYILYAACVLYECIVSVI